MAVGLGSCGAGGATGAGGGGIGACRNSEHPAALNARINTGTNGQRHNVT
jgi:hypothetical protein